MVTIYTKEQCPNCVKSKLLMKKLGIEFDEISIENTPGAREKIMGLGFRAAPVIFTETDSWSGFNEDKIYALISNNDDVWD